MTGGRDSVDAGEWAGERADEWYVDTYDPDWGSRIRIDRVIYRNQTDFQDLIIFDNPVFGRVLGLDGVVQTTLMDEHIYHECMAHVPMFGHGHVREVLIIGGGDGGVLREILKHRAVARVTLVEIDESVVDLCRTHLPEISAGAFDDPRTDLIITDGRAFVGKTDRRFDLIIVDSSDPIGPNQPLFTKAFYGDCKARLTPGGVFTQQATYQIVRYQPLIAHRRKLADRFATQTFFHMAVPSYPGGDLAVIWASDDGAKSRRDLAEITERFEAADIETRYYTPAMHCAVFALPREFPR